MKNLVKISPSSLKLLRAGNLPFIKLLSLSIILYSMNIIYTKKLYKKYPKDNQATEITKDTIFVFDLHGVLFKLNPIEVIKEVFKVPHKLKLFSIIFYPHVIVSAMYSLFKGTVAEKVVIKIDKKFPGCEFISSGLKVLNSQIPIKQSIEIIKDLKKAGYRVYILSNIGERSLDILTHKHPEIFSYFDGITGTTPEDDYIQKPNNIAFEKYIAKFGHDKSKLVFIDDQMKNVLSARNFGISAILFTTPYNLRKKLENLKVL